MDLGSNEDEFWDVPYDVCTDEYACKFKINNCSFKKKKTMSNRFPGPPQGQPGFVPPPPNNNFPGPPRSPQPNNQQFNSFPGPPRTPPNNNNNQRTLQKLNSPSPRNLSNNNSKRNSQHNSQRNSPRNSPRFSPNTSNNQQFNIPV